MSYTRACGMACAALIAACAVGCHQPLASQEAERDIGLTYAGPEGTSPQVVDGVQYEYIATADRERQIIDGFPKLRVGQTREEVRAIMGPPDSNRAMVRKEPGLPFTGWSYVYRLQTRTGGDLRNRESHLSFGTDGKLRQAWIWTPTGLRGIPTDPPPLPIPLPNP